MPLQVAEGPQTASVLNGRVAWFRSALSRRPFLRNVAIMLTGAAGGQAVSILLSPVLTRLFTPQQFGVMSVYAAILAILVVLASLRYELAIPLAASDEDAINLTAVCGCALVVTTIVVGIIAGTFPEATLEALWPTPINADYVVIYRCLLVVGFFCLGGYYIVLYLATREGAFHAIAQTRIAQGVVGPVSQIGLGIVGAGAPGLLVGSILGQSAGTFGLFYGLVRQRLALLRSISWRRMVTLARRYRRFPLIGSWAALIDSAGGTQLLYLWVATHYSAEIAGFIFLAERIVARPLSMVGTSILQVFIGEAGRLVSTDPARLRARFYQVTSRQGLLAIAWIVCANLAAIAFFPIIFGRNWSDATIYLEAMSVGYLAQAVILPVFHTLQITEQQVIAAAWQIGRLLLVIGTLGFSSHVEASASRTVFCYSIAQAASCVVLFLLMARSLRQQRG